MLIRWLPILTVRLRNVQGTLAHEQPNRTRMGHHDRVARPVGRSGATRLEDVSIVDLEFARSSFGDRIADVGAFARANLLHGGEGQHADGFKVEEKRFQNTRAGISGGSCALAPPT